MTNVDLIKQVESTLEDLDLSKSWAAKHVKVTSHHFTQVLKGRSPLSEDLRERIVGLNSKLIQVRRILAS